MTLGGFKPIIGKKKKMLTSTSGIEENVLKGLIFLIVLEPHQGFCVRIPSPLETFLNENNTVRTEKKKKKKKK